MIELVEDVGGVVSSFVEGVIGPGERGFEKASGIGYVHDGRLVGGTIFHNFSPEAGIVELTTASTDPRWLTRQAIQAMFTIPFDQWGCQMVVLRVAETNTRMIEIAQRFGFDGHFIPRLWGRHEGGWVFTLTDDQWRTSRFNRTARHGNKAIAAQDAQRH